MKKLFSAFFFLLAWVPLCQASGIAVISYVEGGPQILREGKILDAKPGAECQTGDILKTPTPECHLDVAINGLAGCRLLPSSECVLSNASSSNMRLEIKSGNAILNLKKLPADSTFEVETPTAVATVRGTQFWGRVDAASPENPVTTFAVRQGEVMILAKGVGENFYLKEGQALDIPKNAAAAPSIRPALAEEMQAMEQASAVKTSA